MDPDGTADVRERLIGAALDRRGWSPILRQRIEGLLDGREDRARLRCCDSGCYVCVKELLAILGEVESGLAEPERQSGA